jgi:hypothetical protein
MTNLYLWEWPKSFPEKWVGAHHVESIEDESFIYFSKFSRGQDLDPKTIKFVPRVNFEAKTEQLSGYDCLPCNGSAPLVNKKIIEILREIAPGDVQFFPARIVCLDGELEGYFFLNVTQLIKGIDHDQSIYSLLDLPDGAKMIYTVRKLVLKPGCMKGHDLARDQDLTTNLLVSQPIYDAFQAAKIKGARLVTPDEYYEGLNALYRRG